MTVMLASSIRQEQAALGKGGRVIVEVDDSPGGLTALRWAVGLARSANAPLVAVRSGRLACRSTAASAVTATAAGTWS
jgi:nucleotide-binding universal stress UspA family protein